jgi:hypothetical protein
MGRMAGTITTVLPNPMGWRILQAERSVLLEKNYELDYCGQRVWFAV